MTEREIDSIASRVAYKLGRMSEPAWNQVQAAEYLGVSVRLLKDRIREGKITAYTADGRTYLYKSDLDSYIQAAQISATVLITPTQKKRLAGAWA